MEAVWSRKRAGARPLARDAHGGYDWEVATLLLLLSLCAAARPPEWAEPVALEGVGNLHRVTTFLYRSEQPTNAGMAALERLGVKTVIDLRAFHSDADEAAGTALALVDFDILTWWVTEDHVVAFLRALRRAEGPVLVHCKHGADRTGLMLAMFRVVEQGWSKEAALAELREGGYGFHRMWANIPRFVRKADVARIRRRVEAP